MMKSSSLSLLRSLRSLMAKENLSAYVVPTCDAHNSEYLAGRDERRAFISGFTGSTGTAVVTGDKALLWTDGRYYLQAEDQLDGDHWTLMRVGQPDTPTRGDWLAANLEQGQSVGVDPFLVPCDEWDRMAAPLAAASLQLRPVADNLVDRVWGQEQPAYPENPVVPLGMEFAGADWEAKVAGVRKTMAAKGADCLVLSALDEVAYLLNLRGSDIPFNPVFFAYAAVTAHRVYLFVSEAQVDERLRGHLKGKGAVENLVYIRPYSDVRGFLDKYAAQSEKKKVVRRKRIRFDF